MLAFLKSKWFNWLMFFAWVAWVWYIYRSNLLYRDYFLALILLFAGNVVVLLAHWYGSDKSELQNAQTEDMQS